MSPIAIKHRGLTYVWMLFFPILLSPTAEAHRLSVFAWIEGKNVKVEGSLSRGRHPKSGEILVYDGVGQLILRKSIEQDGTAVFPLPDWKSGLKIVMNIGNGHQNYWILTPYDIEQQIKTAQDKTAQQDMEGTGDGKN